MPLGLGKSRTLVGRPSDAIAFAGAIGGGKDSGWGVLRAASRARSNSLKVNSGSSAVSMPSEILDDQRAGNGRVTDEPPLARPSLIYRIPTC